MNPRALFRSDVEEFIRDSFQLILLHCLDQNYTGRSLIGHESSL